MKKINPQIQKLHPSYEGIDLSKLDETYMSDQGVVQLWHQPKSPFYVEVGKNLLRFSSLENDNHIVVFAEKLDDKGQTRAHCVFTNGRTEIGRETTPELELDISASRRHIGILVMTSAVQVEDLQSTNGSTLYAAPDALAQGHFTTLFPSQES